MMPILFMRDTSANSAFLSPLRGYSRPSPTACAMGFIIAPLRCGVAYADHQQPTNSD
jgi:hypothetical protein